MYGEAFFFQASVYLLAAVVAVPLAKKLGLGSVLGYLAAGIVIGPFVLKLIGDEGQQVMHYAEFGVVMMLFLVGLELEPAKLWRLRGPILGLGGAQVAVTAVLIGSLAIVFGQTARTAVAVGLTLALSSTAMALQSFGERGLTQTEAGQNGFAVLLFQDIAVIPMLALFPLLATAGAHGPEAAHGVTWTAQLPAWGQTIVILAAVGLLVGAGRFLLRPVFRVIAGTGLRELFTAAALLLVIGIALLMSKVGLSPALGTFLAGVMLADNEYRHELEGDIEPFKGLLLGLFFISVGASIDFALVSDRLPTVTLIVTSLILIKVLVLVVLARVFKMSTTQRLLFALSLAQGGEFGFVLFGFVVGQGIVEPDLAGTLIASVALSMAVSPLLMLLYDRVLKARLKATDSPEREADVIEQDRPVIIAGFGDFGSTVGRLLRANGIVPTVLESDPEHVELLRKLGLQVYYGDASRPDLLGAAGAEKARLLVIAIADHDATMELVRSVRRHFPDLKILARARGRRAAYELIREGVGLIYRDTLDAALRAGTQALREMGFRGFQAHRAAKTFRRHDEEALRELAEMTEDKKAYISTARQRIADLEELMQSENKDDRDVRDLGWDTESLRADFLGRTRE